MNTELTLQRRAAGAAFNKEHAMLRQGLAVVVGFAVWSAVWLASNSVLIELHVLPYGPNTPIRDVGALLALLVAAVITSLTAGCAAAKLTPSTSRQPALILCVLLVIVGAFVQSQLWHLMPLWYHVTFLALMPPVCLVGAKLR
jgi:uncharacterized membrane protein YeaQ/YmgE (transglycosylase-associated protein family)